jgi:hypothetical protein
VLFREHFSAQKEAENSDKLEAFKLGLNKLELEQLKILANRFKTLDLSALSNSALLAVQHTLDAFLETMKQDQRGIADTASQAIAALTFSSKQVTDRAQKYYRRDHSTTEITLATPLMEIRFGDVPASKIAEIKRANPGMTDAQAEGRARSLMVAPLVVNGYPDQVSKKGNSPIPALTVIKNYFPVLFAISFLSPLKAIWESKMHWSIAWFVKPLQFVSTIVGGAILFASQTAEFVLGLVSLPFKYIARLDVVLEDIYKGQLSDKDNLLVPTFGESWVKWLQEKVNEYRNSEAGGFPSKGEKSAPGWFVVLFGAVRIFNRLTSGPTKLSIDRLLLSVTQVGQAIAGVFDSTVNLKRAWNKVSVAIIKLLPEIVATAVTLMALFLTPVGVVGAVAAGVMTAMSYSTALGYWLPKSLDKDNKAIIAILHKYGLVEESGKPIKNKASFAIEFTPEELKIIERSQENMARKYLITGVVVLGLITLFLFAPGGLAFVGGVLATLSATALGASGAAAALGTWLFLIFTVGMIAWGALNATAWKERVLVAFDMTNSANLAQDVTEFEQQIANTEAQHKLVSGLIKARGEARNAADAAALPTIGAVAPTAAGDEEVQDYKEEKKQEEEFAGFGYDAYDQMSPYVDAVARRNGINELHASLKTRYEALLEKDDSYNNSEDVSANPPLTLLEALEMRVLGACVGAKAAKTPEGLEDTLKTLITELRETDSADAALLEAAAKSNQEFETTRHEVIGQLEHLRARLADSAVVDHDRSDVAAAQPSQPKDDAAVAPEKLNFQQKGQALTEFFRTRPSNPMPDLVQHSIKQFEIKQFEENRGQDSVQQVQA